MQTKYLAIFIIIFTIGLPSYGNADTAQKILRVGFSDVDSYPYEYFEDGEVKGLHIDMIREVAAILDYQVMPIRLPWKRLLVMSDEGEVDALSFIGGYRGSHDKTWFYGDNVLSVNGFYLMTKADRKGIKYRGDFSDIKDLKFGVLRGFNFSEFQQQNYQPGQQLSVVEVSSTKQLLAMLRYDRIDAAIVMRSTFADYRYGRLPEFKVHSRPISTIYVYLGFSKTAHTLETVKQFGDVIKVYWDSKEFIRLQQKYDELGKKASTHQSTN